MWENVGLALDRCTKMIYLFFVRVLVFDAWLLSQFTGVRKWLRGKGPKLLWITLPPILFLLGAYIAQRHFIFADSPRNVENVQSSPKRSITDWLHSRAHPQKDFAERRYIECGQKIQSLGIVERERSRACDVCHGEYEVTANSDESWQYFPVQNTKIKSPYEYVEMRIQSDHWGRYGTCLCRYRVHGRSNIIRN
ncbi:PREDICTED: uncharacterized protein LOC105567759 [Vollenhovia emeryi]|uniref:uncharacterized protein LOC105567759 n=1 Tax=Vollenhovia emeryi TaxID=411798 RepID=UPI0005F48E8B|nr:PREDICTED: uncharacterized protein LOC105567759 [Vollenhovia emeryi]